MTQDSCHMIAGFLSHDLIGQLLHTVTCTIYMYIYGILILYWVQMDKRLSCHSMLIDSVVPFHLRHSVCIHVPCLHTRWWANWVVGSTLMWLVMGAKVFWRDIYIIWNTCHIILCTVCNPYNVFTCTRYGITMYSNSCSHGVVWYYIITVSGSLCGLF